MARLALLERHRQQHEIDIATGRESLDRYERLGTTLRPLPRLIESDDVLKSLRAAQETDLLAVQHHDGRLRK
jgi:hypothetical protein